MYSKTAVFIPTFRRPHRVSRIADNLKEVTSAPYDLYFIVEKGDVPTIRAVDRVGALRIYNPGLPTYASCINAAYGQTSHPYFFLGADDLRFTPGWLTMAVACMTDENIGIVGTVDSLMPRPNHSTHCLVRRRYIEQCSGCMDIPDIVLYPYRHAFTDREILGVAKARKKYFYCEDSIVEHHHPGWDALGLVRSDSERFDETYAKGNRHHVADLRTFTARAGQWMDLIEDKSPAGVKPILS